jgi:hypothetical protein
LVAKRKNLKREPFYFGTYDLLCFKTVNVIGNKFNKNNSHPYKSSSKTLVGKYSIKLSSTTILVHKAPVKKFVAKPYKFEIEISHDIL